VKVVSRSLPVDGRNISREIPPENLGVDPSRTKLRTNVSTIFGTIFEPSWLSTCSVERPIIEKWWTCDATEQLAGREIVTRREANKRSCYRARTLVTCPDNGAGLLACGSRYSEWPSPTAIASRVVPHLLKECQCVPVPFVAKKSAC